MNLDSAAIDRVSGAIRSAESQTSAEILCVLARESASYRVYPLLWALVIALLLPAPLLYYFNFNSVVFVYSLQLAAAAALALFFLQPGLQRWIVPGRVKRDRAHGEALRQFAAQGLDQTSGRAGVLLFGSIAERYAEVVADTRIAEKVPQEVWDDAVAAIKAGIRRDRIADGFVDAIEICGRALSQHFPPGAINKDELPNRLVVL